MTITYSWKDIIVYADRTEKWGQPLVVNRVQARLVGTAEDGSESSELVDEYLVLEENSTFIAFENITKDIVVTWLESKMSEQDWVRYKAPIESVLNKFKIKRLD